MQLRSGPSMKRCAGAQEASSHIMSRSPSLAKKRPRRCPFVDDEAIVEEGSNVLLGGESNELGDSLNDLATHQDSENDGEEDTEGDEDIVEEEEIIKHTRHLGKQISLGLMNEVLSQFYVKRRTLPPFVPLCRLVPHEAVRTASDDASWLIPTFDNAAYIQTMGFFLVSLKGPLGTHMPITANNLEQWGPIWRDKNEAFKKALNKEWKDLRGRKFLVWDGNHRLKTWMKRINDLYSDKEKYHVSVRCQFLEVEKKKEVELLLALDTTNVITRAHVKPNLGHEIYMFQKFGIANKESILARLSLEQRAWAEVEMSLEARSYQGNAPWYNSPCVIISQLVWKDDFNAFLSKAKGELKSLALEEKEMEMRVDKATRQEETKLKDKGYKYLCIANPAHGQDFFSLLYSLKWDDASMVKITKDKLHCLCSSKITVERRRTILQLMSLTKAKDPQYNHFGDVKVFRSYMRREVYWSHMHTEAWLIIRRLEMDTPELPEGFDVFYKTSLKVHVLQCFCLLLGEIKSANDSEKMPELMHSSKRLVYRWLRDCVANGTLASMPIVTIDWQDTNDENSMYSLTLIEKGISKWECENCPWWLEYPIGVIPKQEMDLHARFLEETMEPNEGDGPKDGVDGTKEVANVEEEITKTTREPEEEIAMKEDKVKESSTKGVKGSKGSKVQRSISFVAESSIGRPPSERLPITRQMGFQYTTIVDALLVDIKTIDTFAIESITKFYATQKLDLYSHLGAPCREVSRLIFADLPTSLLVNGLGPVPAAGLSKEIVEWNEFSTPLIKGTMDLAHEFLADEGFLVTLCLAQHVGKLLKYASRSGLRLHRTWTLMCDGGYRHPETLEEVSDLTVGIFHRADMPVPRYDRDAGETVSTYMFPASRSALLEGHFVRTLVDGRPVRGGAERSDYFFKMRRSWCGVLGDASLLLLP